ncbi:MAG: hypothetical protein ACRCWI_05210 [Brevinema sp.]
MPYFLLIFIIGLTSPHYSNYIDIRDMTQESARIQRLLGQLDVLKISEYQQQYNDNITQLTMLSMITTGLALSSSQYYRYPYQSRSYYSRRYRPSTTALGSTLTTIGVLGLISSSIAEENRQQTQRLRQSQLTKIETEINNIISNLITSDSDFIRENKNLEIELTRSVSNNILEITQITSNDIQILKQQEQKLSDDFVKNTNMLTRYINNLEKNTTERIVQNITQMSQNSSRVTIKELKMLNKSFKKQLKDQQKEYKKNLKKEIKSFHKLFFKVQKDNKKNITKIEDAKNNRILNELTSAQNNKSALFQKYITLYINKLVA